MPLLNRCTNSDSAKASPARMRSTRDTEVCDVDSMGQIKADSKVGLPSRASLAYMRRPCKVRRSRRKAARTSRISRTAGTRTTLAPVRPAAPKAPPGLGRAVAPLRGCSRPHCQTVTGLELSGVTRPLNVLPNVPLGASGNPVLEVSPGDEGLLPRPRGDVQEPEASFQARGRGFESIRPLSWLSLSPVGGVTCGSSKMCGFALFSVAKGEAWPASRSPRTGLWKTL